MAQACPIPSPELAPLVMEQGDRMGCGNNAEAGRNRPGLAPSIHAMGVRSSHCGARIARTRGRGRRPKRVGGCLVPLRRAPDGDASQGVAGLPSIPGANRADSPLQLGRAWLRGGRCSMNGCSNRAPAASSGDLPWL